MKVDTAASGAVGKAGGVLLTETVTSTGVGRELSVVLAWWRKPSAVHDPAKVITDLAVTLALGGDCLADIGVLRAEPGPTGWWPLIRRSRARSRPWPRMRRRR